MSSPFVNETSRWYQRPYFEQRLQEEIYRSARYGYEVSLVTAEIRVGSAHDARSKVPALLDGFAEEHLRLSDIPGELNRLEFAICLPHTDADGAKVVASRLTKALADFSPIVSQRTFPEEAKSAAELLGIAKGVASMVSEGLRLLQKRLDSA
jgi:hypothetical protein